MSRQLDARFQASTDQGAKGDPATEPPLAEIQLSKRKYYNRAWNSRLQNPEPTDNERLDWWLGQYGLQHSN